ncbi:MAG: ABC transporter permease [Phycisphaeraceae bacterium]
MSDQAVQPEASTARARGFAADVAAPRRSWLGQAGLRLLGKWGARLGLLWVVLLVLLAVFAPLIASSHPLAWKRGGEVTSPWLSNLTWLDVTLFVGFAAAIVAVLVQRLTRCGAGAATLAWIGIVLLTGVICIVAIAPARNVEFKQYRVAVAEGSVEWVVFAPLPYSPNDRQHDRLAAEGVNPNYLPPSARHPMGTTMTGSDVLSRMIHASRIALAIGLVATGIAVSIGIVVGGLMGYFAGWVDLLGMRLVEIFSAVPVIFLLIMIVAMWGPSLMLMMVVIGLTGWVGYALFIRAEFLRIRRSEYVEAGRALGLPLWSILFRHMLPNGVTPVLVLASFGIASAILTESTLSFIGLGLEEEPSWGQMLDQARRAPEQWGLAIFPGLAIFLTVFAYNLIGEALRDAIDPKAENH